MSGGVNERVQELSLSYTRVCHVDMHSVTMHWTSADEREATS